MKTCQDFEALLSLFSNNELAAESRAAVASHLVNCAACRQKIEDYHELKKYLFKLPTPALPENLFADFHQGVLEKISRSGATPKQRLGLIAVLYALYRRQRFVIAVATLIMLIAVPAWLTHSLRTPSQPRPNLAQLLEKRDWKDLYYALLKNETRNQLLDQPVPVHLLHNALVELAAQGKDRNMRTGLQRALARLKTRDGVSLGWAPSIQILGKVTPTGFETTRRSNRPTWRPETSAKALHRYDANALMTLRQLLLISTLKG